MTLELLFFFFLFFFFFSLSLSLLRAQLIYSTCRVVGYPRTRYYGMESIKGCIHSVFPPPLFFFFFPYIPYFPEPRMLLPFYRTLPLRPRDFRFQGEFIVRRSRNKVKAISTT